MKILVVSDIHGNEKELSCLKEEAERVDLILAAGDLTHFGNTEDAARIIAALRRLNPQVLAVAGNCDSREIEHALHTMGVGLGQSAVEMDGMQIFGISGAMQGPIRTPYEVTDQDLSLQLEKIHPASDKPVILVSHQPPYKSVADKAMKVKHVGSKAVRDWIHAAKPLLVLTGHIHESYGQEETGGVNILNPGAFKEGRYALVEIDSSTGSVKVELHSCRR